ncbi:hypothetical protein I7I53_09038 [Histoplasma capsulatum var. duboisii H88]|uniref:Uncharacterized protein n=1 Tax=Ajellomyces capsulatus (strain H88) TaxID=544711 RepID=A0A8A1L862_AJEC8|nr:hypothetical protein I7I53_09038 [Histoplasma capsulatum var. duboisii H88]
MHCLLLCNPPSPHLTDQVRNTNDTANPVPCPQANEMQISRYREMNRFAHSSWPRRVHERYFSNIRST